MDSSSNNNSQVAWGKLTSFTDRSGNINLIKDSYIIGSNATNDIHINSQNLSERLCKISHDAEYNFWVEDLTEGAGAVLIDEEKLEKGGKRQLRAGETIHFIPTQENSEKVLGYIFSPVHPKKSDSLKNPRGAQETPEEAEKRKKFEARVGEEIYCSICLGPLYKCATIMPCLHNYCLPCISDYMKDKKNCPRCREEFNDVRENPPFDKVVISYLNANPEKKRKPEEYAEMDKRIETPVQAEPFKLANGDEYEGFWLRLKRHGAGKMTYASGEVYDGNWVENKRDGTGIFTSKDGETTYTGDWKNDTRHGKGVETYPNGEIFEGSYVDGRKEGEGIVKCDNGDKFQEIWVNGSLQSRNQL